jgi:hypothetical protein
MRQALAGMLWSKQFFFYDVGRWLKQHGIQPYKTNRRSIRNDRWGHMVNADIISMPDKWEYPWYAAWPRWTPENRPVVDGAKPAIGAGAQAGVL